MQALFWAETHNWTFAKWRDKKFDALKHQKQQSLINAMRDSAYPTDADIKHRMEAYFKRMDPTQRAVACGACGTLAVPVTEQRIRILGGRIPVRSPLRIPRFFPVRLPTVQSRRAHLDCALSERRDSLSFGTPPEQPDSTIPLTSPTAATCPTAADSHASAHGSTKTKKKRGCATYGTNCPWLLLPLEYTPLQKQEYVFPQHISDTVHDTPDNREHYNRYRLMRSSVVIDADGHVVTETKNGLAGGHAMDTNGCIPNCVRLHLAPDLCATSNSDTTFAGTGGNTLSWGPDNSADYTMVCDMCLEQLLQCKKPHISIASYYDLGQPERAGMPNLTLAERLAVSQTCIFSTMLRINLDHPNRDGVYNSFTQHVVAVPMDAAVQSNTGMTLAQLAKQNAMLTITAPVNLRSEDGKIRKILRFLNALKCRPPVVLDWLRMAWMLNPEYFHLTPPDIKDIESDLAKFVDELLRPDSRTHITIDPKTATRAATARSDYIHPENDPSMAAPASSTAIIDEDQLTEHARSLPEMPALTLLRPRSSDPPTDHDINLRILNAIHAAIPPPVTATFVDDVPASPHATDVAMPPAERPLTVVAHCEMKPINEYEKCNSIIYRSHLTTFPLAQGLGASRGPIPPRDVRHWHLTHYSNRPGTDELLQAYVHNAKLRADNAKETAAVVHTDPMPMRTFRAEVEAKTFPADLAESRQNPTSRKAKALLHRMSPLIKLVGSRIPFGPFQRTTQGMTQVVALSRWKDAPTMYYTIAPNETHSTIIARISCPRLVPQDPVTGTAPLYANQPASSATAFWKQEPGVNNALKIFIDDISEVHPMPPSVTASVTETTTAPAPPSAPDSGSSWSRLSDGTIEWRQKLTAEITANPAAVALICQRMTDAFHDELLCVPHEIRRTKAVFETHPRGLFGRAHSYYWVTEVEGRMQLHWHGLLWGGLPHWLTQRCAGSPLEETVAECLSRVYSASVRPEFHATHLWQSLRRFKMTGEMRKATDSIHAACYCPPPLGLSAAEIMEWGEAVSAIQGVHSHCDTCHTGRGQHTCRLGYGRGIFWNIIAARAIARNRLNVEQTVLTTSPSPISVARELRARAVIPQQTPATAAEATTHHKSHTKARIYPEFKSLEGSQLPYLPKNADETTHELLQRLARPGGDRRLIEYPHHRPLNTIHPSIFGDEGTVDRENAMRELLKRQHLRLCDVYKQLGHELPHPPLGTGDYVTAQDYAKFILEMMKVVGYGEFNNEHSQYLLPSHKCFAEIQSLPIDVRTDFADYFSQLNALLGETNLPASAALGCSVNTQSLVSKESALHAMFYIVPYIMGDMMTPAALLDLVEAARIKCETYEGSAPPGETAESNDHPIRRFIQVIGNGPIFLTEYATQQCCLNYASLAAQKASPFFSYVFTKPLICAVRAANSNHRFDDDCIAQQVGQGLAPLIHRHKHIVTDKVDLTAHATSSTTPASSSPSPALRESGIISGYKPIQTRYPFSVYAATIPETSLAITQKGPVPIFIEDISLQPATRESGIVST